MPAKSQYIYWDACSFLAYIKKEPKRFPIVEAVLDEVEKSRGGRKIITSLISKAEVAYGLQSPGKKVLDLETEQKIDQLWTDDSVIELVEVHDIIVQ